MEFSTAQSFPYTFQESSQLAVTPRESSPRLVLPFRMAAELVPWSQQSSSGS